MHDNASVLAEDHHHDSSLVSLSLSASLSLCHSIALSVSLFVSLSLSPSLSLSVILALPLYLSLCLYLSLSLCLSLFVAVLECSSRMIWSERLHPQQTLLLIHIGSVADGIRINCPIIVTVSGQRQQLRQKIQPVLI